MKMNRIAPYLLFPAAAFSFSKAFTQSNSLVNRENELIALHTKIDDKLKLALSKRYDSTINDSVDYFVAALESGFTRLITGDPETINYPFYKLRDSSICHITTAGDGNMRVYNLHAWQLLTEIYQWKERGKVYTKVLKYQKDSTGLCREIFVVPVKRKKYYLPVTSTILWPKHALQSVAVWRINGNRLEAVPLLKNRSGRLNHLDVSFSFYNFAPKLKDSLLAFISYNESEKKLYVPFVNGEGVFTKNYFIYELKDDGLEFTRMGEMKQERGMVDPPRK